MNTTAATVISGVGLVGACALFAIAGPITPPAGGPSPSYKTLDEVEPRVPIHQSDIPLTISIPGSYYLAEHLFAVGIGTDPVITVVADDVAIDLRGFTIDGGTEVSAATAGIEYDGAADNLVVRNGTIRDCGGPGITFVVGTDGTAAFHDLMILDNLDDGINLSGSFIRVTDCTIINNDGVGVVATSILMRDCFVQGNTDEGVTGFGGLIQSNVIVGNGGAGNVVLLGGTVIENEAP